MRGVISLVADTRQYPVLGVERPALSPKARAVSNAGY
jgi:hypothetical protein